MKVEDATKFHDVCSQTTEDDIINVEKKWNSFGTRKSLLESCRPNMEAPLSPHNICANHVLSDAVPAMDQCAAVCSQTTENDIGLKKRTHDICEENSNLTADGDGENSPGRECAVSKAIGELQEHDDKSLSKKEGNQVKTESSGISDISGRISGSDETQDSSGHDSERTEEKKKHKQKTKDKSRLKEDRHQKRSGSRKAKVRKKRSKDRDKEKKDDRDELNERRKIKKRSKHKKDRTNKYNKDKISDKNKRDKGTSNRKHSRNEHESSSTDDDSGKISPRIQDTELYRKTRHGDYGSEVAGGGEDTSRAWEWNTYYEGWTRTGTDYDDGVRAWDQSEYGGGDGKKDLAGGWDLSGTESIAEQVERAATAALQGNSFVYNEQLGLYYDYSSGYYYNSVSL